MFLWILLGVYVFSWIVIGSYCVWENENIKGPFTFLEEVFKLDSENGDILPLFLFAPAVLVLVSIAGLVNYVIKKTKKRRENLKAWFKRKTQEERNK